MAKETYTGSVGGASPQEKTAAKKAVAQEAIDAAKNTTTKDISNAAVSIGANAVKPAAAPEDHRSTAAPMVGDVPGMTSTIPSTDKNRSTARPMPGEGTVAESTKPYPYGPDSGRSTGAVMPGDIPATPEAAKPDVIYDPNWLNGEYVGPSGGGSTPTAPADGTTPESGETASEEKEKTTPEKSQEEQLRDAWAAAGEVTKRLVEGATPEDIDISAIDKVDVSELESKLEQIRKIQEERAAGQIDYAVEQGVNDVNRAVEDADPQFQTQRNQISADEQRALDNQVLYAEARGDRGGIGQSQYASIQNNAATNRYRVNQEQTKLSTDAARQIADLRAKGEFEKADSLLQISQNYLSELKALEQWALQTNLSVDEFNTQLEQWLANYNMSRDQFLINAEMSAANMTGAFSDGTPTLAARDKVENQLANAAQALFQLGIPLTDEQIAALGWTKGQYTQYMNEQAVANAAGGVDRTSLPIYLTNPDTGNLEQVSGEFYRNYLNYMSGNAE